MNEKFNFNRENGASSFYEEKNLSPVFFMQKLVI